MTHNDFYLGERPPMDKTATLVELFALTHDRPWPEELLGEDFFYVVERVLSKKERQILEHKVQGYSNKEIADIFGITGRTLSVWIQKIKKKLSIEVDPEVDDHVRRKIYRDGVRTKARRRFRKG